MLGQKLWTTLFRLKCDAERVYLRLRMAQGSSPQMIPMYRSGEGTWAIKLPLEPGTYRYRFYSVAPGGSLMLYHPPDGVVRGLRSDGLDGVMCVGDELPAA